MADQINEYQKKVSSSFNKFVAPSLRAEYPSIANDATDDELVQVWREMTLPDADETEAYQVLTELYGEGWEPPDEKSLGEKVGDFSKAALGVGKDITQGLAEFGGALAAKAKGGNVAGQIAMATPTVVRGAGHYLAGRDLEKTAEGMPQPNIDEMRSKGYSEQQIQNVLKGYADTQQSIYGDVEEQGKEGLAEVANLGANALFLNPTGKTLGGAAKALTGKATGQTLKSGVEHGVANAAVGAGFGATQQATERALQATAEGKKSDEILSDATAGVLQGGLVGGAAGGILGGTIGAVGSHSAARQAAKSKMVNDALAVRLKNFGDTFKTDWLTERFPADLKFANENGLSDEQLALRIIETLYGPEVAASENGMRAAGTVFEKISKWRKVNEGLAGPMVDLPKQPIGPEAIPNIAQPVGAPLTSEGGQAPIPNIYDQGPMGQQFSQAPSPTGVQPPPGMEGMPVPQQGTVPFQLEPVAPGQSAEAAARLSQPLDAQHLTPPAPFEQGAAIEPNRMGTGQSAPPEVDYNAPPGLPLRGPDAVPVRNSGGGPEDFGVRELTGPSGAPPDPVDQMTAQLQEALAAGDTKLMDKLMKEIKKEMHRRKVAARKEKTNA